MKQFRLVNLLLAIPGLFLIASCNQEEKTVDTVKRLVIASDYLEEEDTALFELFCAKHDIQVRIVNMSADRMIGHFRNRKYDNGIDLIMLRSLYDVNRLTRHDLFHPIDQVIGNSGTVFDSYEYDFIGVGINPYVLAYKQGSNHQFRTYNELRDKPFFTNLDKAQLVPLFAGIMPTHHKVGTYDWIEDFSRNKSTVLDYDSTGNNYCLTLYDEHFHRLTDTAYAKVYDVIHYPNQSGKGMFYDLRTISVVDQAENFTSAQTFIEFYLDKGNNERFCKGIHVLPLDSEKDFRLNRHASNDLIQYYVLVERMLTKLEPAL